MVFTATITHWTTCFRPFARLIARKGRSTRRTLRIFTTDIAPELKRKTWRLKRKIENLDDLFGGDQLDIIGKVWGP